MAVDKTATRTATRTAVQTAKQCAELPDGTVQANASKELQTVDVKFLDESVKTFQIAARADGQVLFDQVCHVLNVFEREYFGLAYQDTQGTRYWLDYGKRMADQLGLDNRPQPMMEFAVKFYVPDPTQLEEEYTRYMFALQVKKDLASGDLPAAEDMAALLCSYIVQATFGDFVASECADGEYLSRTKFVPKQTRRFEEAVMAHHRRHVGQSPLDADRNLLDHVRKCDLYGVKMVAARDTQDIPLNLAVAHMGLLVLQSTTRINTFSWNSIRKLSFKKKRFLIKFHPTEGYGYYRKVEEFTFPSRNAAKSFWKRCVENHGFFWLTELPKSPPRYKTRIFSRGSSFRYSGRTQKQIIDQVREGGDQNRNRTFARSVSLRQGPLPEPPKCIRRSLIAAPPASTSSPMVEEKRFLDSPYESKVTPIPGNEFNHTPISGEAVPYRDIFEKRSSVIKDANANSVRIITDQNRNGIFVDSELCRNLFLELHSTPMENRLNSFDRRASLQEQETSYYVSKELLMTERTYKRDLEIITFWFRDHFDDHKGHKSISSGDDPGELATEFIGQLFQLLDPVYKLHCRLLRDLEHRIAAMEGRPVTGTNSFEGVGSLLLEYSSVLTHYKAYAGKLPSLLDAFEAAFNQSTSFRCAIESFETNKVCYVPLALLFTRPLHRLAHYSRACSKLTKFYPGDHPDRSHCEEVIDRLKPVITGMSVEVQQAKNHVKLMELERDLGGVDNILDKQFLREGSLMKLSKKGYQQRMFFLFNDCLVYANRVSDDPGLKFKAHGQITLKGVMVEAGEPRLGMENCFTIYAPHRALMVAAPSETERHRWITAIQRAVDACSSPEDDINAYSTLQSCASSDDGLSSAGAPSNRSSVASNHQLMSPVLAAKLSKSNQYPRCNTTLHVCWLRQISVSREDYERAGLSHHMSGYLLRKFKHSTGWQKLWIVFSDFSLFFYKSYQDTTPLACLPLLGYNVGTPDVDDGIDKQFVLKLQFKAHTYFFRAESDYTFQRWLEAIGSVTS
ncbi:ferm [Tropilaelaps mercedesae]|uniref:Ferm n=1 Tax=Tropilaelaps mercedesae TaxID=418985 RepID=A0A1V9XEH1_9ACAR|nr:ferm [Tropilaelaps mercedesae]